jgi:hypothetical protein
VPCNVMAVGEDSSTERGAFVTTHSNQHEAVGAIN